MKRLLICILLILSALCLSCCSKEPPSVSADFSAPFTVTRDDADYAGELSISGGALHIEMTAPYTVAGICYDYDSEGLTISTGGLSTRANDDYLPSAAIPEVLHNTLSYLPQAAFTEAADGVNSFTLPTPYGDALLSAVDGVPTALYDPHSELTFTFQ